MIAIKTLSSLNELKELRESVLERSRQEKKIISVCCGTGCRANGALELCEAFREALAEQGIDNVGVKATGCHGFCEKGPLVVILPEETFYHGVRPEHVPEIISKTVLTGELVKKLQYIDKASKKRCALESEVPFYAKQQRIVFRSNGKISPDSIHDYIAIGGYESLGRVLSEKSPEETIDEIKQAGLRGRGGGGFPTGNKWEFCRRAAGEEKYIICNGDEGDPGAFMDRSIMEGNPHSILEGMSIGAYAIGAGQGYLYVRSEYPLAVENLATAIGQAYELGLLGEKILGSDFSFNVDIVRGAGAFVCGEETGLIASIEGDIGSPRQRPPFPAQQGLWNKPTNINNVETWATVPVIIERGADWFASIGTERSKGTKVFSLVGKVNNTGLVEVPMGMTVREIVYDIGGGIQKKREFKAVQTGGPSGGCIPESLLDLPIDFDALIEAGAMMGSGGLIVMDDHTCMVDVARYFLEFLADESCGKCTPCREGVDQMLRILNRITTGKGKMEDMETLQDLCSVIKSASLCALGGTAPNPVLSTIRYFKNEYEAHIVDRKCPAGVCKELTEYEIDEEKCKGCGRCVKDCPTSAIAGEKKSLHILDRNVCIKCGVCYDTCPFNAIVAV